MSNPSDTDIAWLAGLLEGEGCFWVGLKAHGRPPSPRARQSIVISLKMTDLDVVERAKRVMRGTGKTGVRPAAPSRQEAYQLRVSGYEAERIMRLVRPYMGLRRGAKIDEILAAPAGTYSHQPRTKEAT